MTEVTFYVMQLIIFSADTPQKTKWNILYVLAVFAYTDRIQAKK